MVIKTGKRLKIFLIILIAFVLFVFAVLFLERDFLLFVGVRIKNLNLSRVCLLFGANANARDKNSWTPLLYTVKNNDSLLTKLLLDHGADPNRCDLYKKLTALHRAALDGGQAVTELLISHKAKVDVFDTSGMTPLAWAVWEQNIPVIKVLLLHKADPNAYDKLGGIPLTYAVEKKNISAIQLLLQNGANTSLIDRIGFSPFCIAIRDGYVDIVKAFLDAGVDLDVNQRNKEGMTPLITAVVFRRNEIAKMISESRYKVNFNLLDSMGYTALMHAVLHSDTTCAKSLLQSGADPHIKSSYGYDVFKMVIAKKDINMVKILDKYF